MDGEDGRRAGLSRKGGRVMSSIILSGYLNLVGSEGIRGLSVRRFEVRTEPELWANQSPPGPDHSMAISPPPVLLDATNTLQQRQASGATRMTSASNAAIMAKMESQVLAEYAAVAANLDHVSRPPRCCRLTSGHDDHLVRTPCAQLTAPRITRSHRPPTSLHPSSRTSSTSSARSSES